MDDGSDNQKVGNTLPSMSYKQAEETSNDLMSAAMSALLENSPKLRSPRSKLHSYRGKEEAFI